MDFKFIKNLLLDIEINISLLDKFPEKKNMFYQYIEQATTCLQRDIDLFACSCEEAKNKDREIRSIIREIMMYTKDEYIYENLALIGRNLGVIMKNVYDRPGENAKKLEREIYSLIDCKERAAEDFISQKINIGDFVGIYSNNPKLFHQGIVESIVSGYITVSGINFPYKDIRFFEIYYA